MLKDMKKRSCFGKQNCSYQDISTLWSADIFSYISNSNLFYSFLFQCFYSSKNLFCVFTVPLMHVLSMHSRLLLPMAVGSADSIGSNSFNQYRGFRTRSSSKSNSTLLPSVPNLMWSRLTGQLPSNQYSLVVQFSTFKNLHNKIFYMNHFLNFLKIFLAQLYRMQKFLFYLEIALRYCCRLFLRYL